MEQPLTLRQQLERGQRLLGSFHGLVDPFAVESAGRAGFDFVVLEHEHGAGDLLQLRQLITAADAAGVPALVRLADPDALLVERVLGFGAAGLLVSHVQTAEQARSLVRWCQFSPSGERGAGPLRGRLRRGDLSPAEARHLAETEILIFAIIEDLIGVRELPEILEVAGLSGIVPGPGDLALSMGEEHGAPAVVSVLDDIARQTAASDRYLMTVCVDPPAAVDQLRMGSDAILFGFDTMWLERFYRDARNQLADARERAGSHGARS